jgi:hypothetical protein
MSSRNTIQLLGICTILLWLSYALYFPPFVETPDIKGLAEEGYEWYLKEHPNATMEEVEKDLWLDIYSAYARGIIHIMIGIITGIFVYRHKRIGQYLAIILCMYMLAWRSLAVLTSSGITRHVKTIYIKLLLLTPIPIIHKDIIAPAFFIFSIIFLLRRTVSRKFT